LYEVAQPNKERSNLSAIRNGEYEGFASKILLPEWNLLLPGKLVKFLGVTGWVMIVLEAGLKLKLAPNKKQVIKNSCYQPCSYFFYLWWVLRAVCSIGCWSRS